MTLSRASAAEALARVEADPEVRAVFLAAYTGDEDAVAALREVADPRTPSAASVARAERLKDWQRVAYGRTTSPAEEEVAAHARDEIVWEEDHRASVAAALELAVAAIRPKPAPPVPVAMALEPEVEAPRRRNLVIPIVIIAAVVFGIGIGAVIATGAARSLVRGDPHTPSEQPSATRPPDTSSVTRTYAATQLQGWFDTTAEAADTFPQPNYLTFIGLHDSNTRFVATSSTGWSLWVGKSTTGETCLLLNGTTESPTTSLSSCLSAAALGKGRPLVITSHGLDATLTGRHLVVTITEG